jgi:hypothetical protein
MKKMYDKKSMTKKAWKEKQKQNRVVNGFNTGTRTMKTAKNPTRADFKKELRKALDKY